MTNEKITIDDFIKIDPRVGKILDAEEVEEEPQDLLKTIQEAAEQQLPDEAPPVSDEEDSDPEEAEPIVEEAEG